MINLLDFLVNVYLTLTTCQISRYVLYEQCLDLHENPMYMVQRNINQKEQIKNTCNMDKLRNMPSKTNQTYIIYTSPEYKIPFT